MRDLITAAMHPRKRSKNLLGCCVASAYLLARSLTSISLSWLWKLAFSSSLSFDSKRKTCPWPASQYNRLSSSQLMPMLVGGRRCVAVNRPLLFIFLVVSFNKIGFISSGLPWLCLLWPEGHNTP